MDLLSKINPAYLDSDPWEEDIEYLSKVLRENKLNPAFPNYDKTDNTCNITEDEICS